MHIDVASEGVVHCVVLYLGSVPIGYMGSYTLLNKLDEYTAAVFTLYHVNSSFVSLLYSLEYYT